MKTSMNPRDLAPHGVHALAATEAPSHPAAAATEAAPPELLPKSSYDELMSSGDVGAMVAAMLLKASANSRATARAAKEAALRSEEAAARAKLELMQDKADASLVAGIVGGGATAVSGLVSGSCAFANGDKAEKALTGAAKGLDGSGNVARSVWDFDAANREIEVQAQERRLLQAKRGVESASDDDRDARELARKVLGFYAEYQRSKEDARKAALFRA